MGEKMRVNKLQLFLLAMLMSVMASPANAGRHNHGVNGFVQNQSQMFLAKNNKQHKQERIERRQKKRRNMSMGDSMSTVGDRLTK
jgi:hypothetical protein